MVEEPPVAGESSQTLDFLRLIRSENVGPITCRRLLDRYSSAAAALEALPELARRGGRRRAIRICSKAEAEAELEAMAALGMRVLTLADPDYPEALAAIDDPPPVLTCFGDPALLSRPTVGIVGARNASANGRRLARELAADLGTAGLVIASGLARGIDAAAHEGALANGTVAVQAGGADIVYPQENQGVYDRIREAGVVLSEMPAGTVPQARHFPRRNRLISGLSTGVVVVEAALRSGSLITARFALEQGREVMAVPGSPLDPRAAGCNRLIKQGAALVESAEDVLEACEGFARALGGPRPARKTAAAAAPSTPENVPQKAHAVLKELLGPSPVLLDEVVRQAQLSAAVVNTALLELELAGRVVRHPGNRVSLVMAAGDPV